jgi:hypothetical protein
MNVNVVLRRLVTIFISALVLCGGLHTRDVLHAGGQAVPVVRTPGDGLDPLVSTDIVLGSDDAFATDCSTDTIKKSCCPGACAAQKKSGEAYSGREALKACVKGRGCSPTGWGDMSYCNGNGFGC